MNIYILIITGLILTLFLVIYGAKIVVQMKKEEMENQFRQELNDLTKYHGKVKLGGVIKQYLDNNSFIVIKCTCGARVKLPRLLKTGIRPLCPKCKESL